ncbi:group 1 glycosyl transferase [Paenibacillus mucilaginosus 3016]|uniref:Group 1 glycosyl transferase n=2 Tax=Paenibacillus mucilaginosus TaxID=61624 RepID=H6NRQ6_9BACL|nr:glycosyltransferase [Paenibacillus mucilaginosus]AFC32792.1 group 1 glycosyl transferase [Paenibacillus mucilaginosus 3016]AFH65128.1 glycosyl transferase family 1 [Paenibacillus mucilaginosus K02]AFK65456.1 glycosyltransferase group 1 family protein [Paenibacillus mucilaginosus K02]WFA21255.1 glycosyltransferase [Paenibacillus mucilaginosus]
MMLITAVKTVKKRKRRGKAASWKLKRGKGSTARRKKKKLPGTPAKGKKRRRKRSLHARGRKGAGKRGRMRLRKRVKKRRRRIKHRIEPAPLQIAVQEEHPPAEAPAQTTEEVPQLLPGAALIGYARGEFGLGESLRLAAGAMEAAGIPFGIIDYPLSGPSRDTSWIHKESTAMYRTNIFHVNADSMGPVWQFVSGRTKGRYNIGYWHWELPDLREADLQAFDYVDEVWTPTAFVQESVKKRSPVPVMRIPHGIHVPVQPEWGRAAFALPADRFLFMSMFDVHSSTRRKNPHAVISAFKEAFGPDDRNVGLVLKVKGRDSGIDDLHTLYRLLEGYRNIYLIERVLSRLEVNSLLNSVDCFVSLHRSEGFGLGLAEAMYLGKPVIGTNWSGNTDFMRPDNACPVDYRLVPVGESWGPYDAGQIWAEPDTRHAAAYMRELVSHPGYRARIAANGQQTIRSEFSPRSVGEQIRARLSELGLL